MVEIIGLNRNHLPQKSTYWPCLALRRVYFYTAYVPHTMLDRLKYPSKSIKSDEVEITYSKLNLGKSNKDVAAVNEALGSIFS